MSNENKKEERSWMSSTAMKLAMVATAAASLSSCTDVTSVYGPKGQYMGGVTTYSQTNAAKIGLGYVQTAANLYGHLDNNQTAKDIVRTIVNGGHGHHDVPSFDWGDGNGGHSCMPQIPTSRPVPIPTSRPVPIPTSRPILIHNNCR